jgi:hypothetical protein
MLDGREHAGPEEVRERLADRLLDGLLLREAADAAERARTATCRAP